MNKFLRKINDITVVALGVVLLAAGWSPVTEAALRKVKCGKDDLQKVIAASVNGDTIELTGICSGNFRIDGKDLTLVGASTVGPHGIQGTDAAGSALFISRSNATVLQNLSFSNGAGSGVRTQYSTVSMSNCTVSNNGFNGIAATHSSRLNGDHLLLEGNARGALNAFFGSRVDCLECDFNGNLRLAAGSDGGSLVTLLDSVVTGRSGIGSSNNSYIDIDCQSFDTAHACSLQVNEIAGQAFTGSTVVFYGSGDFWGQVQANDRSEAQLVGARQLSTGVVSATNSNPRSNDISSGSSLRVDPWDNTVGGSSRLMGTTNVSDFSHALIYGANTELEGDLNCSSAGDAWVEASVDLVSPGFSINGCEHAP